jgi:hypothetical protein
MKKFNDISALSGFLREVIEKYPIEQRRAVFADCLEQQLDFTKDQAALYSSTVLARNVNGSGNSVTFSAIKVAGTWIRMEQEGMAAGWLKSVTETWKFLHELTCEYKYETYEGYTSPFGSSYSRPTSNKEEFIWASSDFDDQNLKVVIVPLSGGGARTLTFVWMDDQAFPRKCSINGVTFVKQ